MVHGRHGNIKTFGLCFHCRRTCSRIRLISSTALLLCWLLFRCLFQRLNEVGDAGAESRIPSPGFVVVSFSSSLLSRLLFYNFSFRFGRVFSRNLHCLVYKATKKDILKFELAVILNFDRDSESELTSHQNRN